MLFASIHFGRWFFTTIAVLLWPHANARYFASIRDLSKMEMGILLSGQKGVGAAEFCTIEGMEFLCFEAEALDEELQALLRRFSSGYAVFQLEGGLLRPLLGSNQLLLGQDLSSILKYKGKTNEMFTGLLVNVAVFSSAYRDRFREPLEVLDPMCGRGTALFEALRRGYRATGIEIDKTDVQQVEQFLKKYLEYNRYKFSLDHDSLTVPGAAPARRLRVRFASDAAALKEKPFSLDLVLGDTLQAKSYFKQARIHALVCDLPYGVKHESREGKDLVSLDTMMKKALVSWQKALLPGAGLALSFNSYTLSLAKARGMLEEAGYEVLRGGEYDGFSHWVEQAIQRDVVVARFPGNASKRTASAATGESW